MHDKYTIVIYTLVYIEHVASPVHHCRRIPVHAMACLHQGDCISIPYITHANGSLVFSDSGLQWSSCLAKDRKTSLSVESLKRLLHLCVTTTYVVHVERQIEARGEQVLEKQSQKDLCDRWLRSWGGAPEDDLPEERLPKRVHRMRNETEAKTGWDTVGRDSCRGTHPWKEDLVCTTIC